ncbi:uncharacterized protein CELE_F26A3.7 [Caenorhabditis elegans]|uniref:Uncharacterized protein F26A3.7 n=1 Tax=Caenorhabditis elegans TaxID=6239 RepID=YUBO_CAEEL|nr:Uncharacterized protein CELE_F26A3.7 [Caenorhabditis elegans]Q93591.2 RecName: Full=Uncharacterized protein F26A3.7 [Caenorhabditis elegans]CAB01706.1 Uncharacterized protein CELE_F26A3.7 [Caenorhabditis elegans]|eukprot:NP_492136.1 Uncharacterized protein CELE_F26A3.7 [Caenorhabditis elegans]
MSYGPQLPAFLMKGQIKENEVDDEAEEGAPQVYGPVIPGMEEPKNEKEKHDDQEETSVFGPSIPKEVREKLQNVENPAEDDEEDEEFPSQSYGPSIPSNFRPTVGPSIPGTFGDDSDEDIGPMPVAKGDEEKEAIDRAYRMVLQKEAEDDEKNFQPKREEWMTSVPKKLGNFGLGARTFKKGTTSERDASWEDAPGAKKRRNEETRSARSVGIAAADARQAAIVAEKTSGPSLLEIHQKKRDEKVKDAGYAQGERRPFDREKDMEVRGLKPGGSKEAVDRMKEFADRFANSKDQRFL